jgi:hypothetical protein
MQVVKSLLLFKTWDVWGFKITPNVAANSEGRTRGQRVEVAVKPCQEITPRKNHVEARPGLITLYGGDINI